MTFPQVFRTLTAVDRAWLSGEGHHSAFFFAFAESEPQSPSWQAFFIMQNFINWQNWFDETAKNWDVLKDFPSLDWV